MQLADLLQNRTVRELCAEMRVEKGESGVWKERSLVPRVIGWFERICPHLQPPLFGSNWRGVRVAGGGLRMRRFRDFDGLGELPRNLELFWCLKLLMVLRALEEG